MCLTKIILPNKKRAKSSILVEKMFASFRISTYHIHGPGVFFNKFFVQSKRIFRPKKQQFKRPQHSSVANPVAFENGFQMLSHHEIQNY